jgi:squalene synthase HpnC
MYALYAFARGVDDLGDESAGDRLAALDEWERLTRLAVAGEDDTDPSTDAVRSRLPWPFDAIAATASACRLPQEPFLRLIEANRRDQRQHRYGTWEDLLVYCTYSADPVGRLVLAIFGRDRERLRPMSDAVCTALQLTNFWQDIRRDLEMGRIYLPGEDMTAHGVTEADLRATTASDAVRSLVREEVARTRALFDRGRPLADEVGGRLGADIGLFTAGGEAILAAIEAQGYDVLRARPTLGRSARRRLVLKALLDLLPGVGR